MAKFTRFDSRNKKRGKHKNESQNKDLRLRETKKEQMFKYSINNIEELYDDEKPIRATQS